VLRHHDAVSEGIGSALIRDLPVLCGADEVVGASPSMVTFGGACEKVIVGPVPAGGGPEPRAAELAAMGVTVVGYEQDAERFEFRMG
jgi:hypothetical protein